MSTVRIWDAAVPGPVIRCAGPAVAPIPKHLKTQHLLVTNRMARRLAYLF